MTKVLYTGSFDPITNGHMDIISQASTIFDEVLIAILINNEKNNSFFTPKERLNIIKRLISRFPNVNVISSNGVAVDIAKQNNCQAIIRGLRNLRDFDYELSMSITNNELSDNEINTLCLFANPNFQHISSSLVKEIFKLKKDISKYVDPLVENAMNEKYEVIYDDGPKLRLRECDNNGY